MKNMSLSIAVQLFSVRDYAEKDLRKTLEEVKKMGYDGVEFAGFYAHNPEDIKKWCEELGLTPISAHVPYYEILSNPEAVLSTYASVGCKYVAIPYLTPECRPGTDGFAEVVKNAESFGKVAKSLGMTLLYHNHDFEFEKVGEEYALDMLYRTVPADLLQTELDTCWVNVGGENPANYIRKYSGRSPVVHLKDFVGGKAENMYELIGIESEQKAAEPTQFEFRPVGYGRQDFPEIIKASKEAGAEWVVVEQDVPSMGLTSMESIQKSIEYLKTLEL